jgi:hypothetical protein
MEADLPIHQSATLRELAGTVSPQEVAPGTIEASSAPPDTGTAAKVPPLQIALGVVVSGGLYWLGVPNAVMWGMLVAVLNVVPYFGPVAGILLLAAVGLLTFDTLWIGLLPPAWYLLLHLLEANLITPVLLGRRFTLNPVVIFVSLIFWTWLWGVPGALLSVPILVSIKVVCDRVPCLSHVSELLTSESNTIFDNLKLLRLRKLGAPAGSSGSIS